MKAASEMLSQAAQQQQQFATAATASSGTLRTKISLKGANGQAKQQTIPFLCMQPELPCKCVWVFVCTHMRAATSTLNGGANLLELYDIRPSSSTVPSLATYLSHLPGTMPDLTRQTDVGNTLRSLIDKPPITSKQIVPLSTTALGSFRLQPGSVSGVRARVCVSVLCTVTRQLYIICQHGHWRRTADA